jgi:uncharacterized coiled-coil protein SlyX
MPLEHTECTQETTIAEIALGMKFVGETLADMKHTQDRLVSLLEKVATQDARLDHLEDHQEKMFQDVQNLYGRMRDAELVIAAGGLSKLRESVDDLSEKVTSALTKIGKLNTFLKWTTHRYAMVFYAVILAMIFISFLNTASDHWDMFKSVWFFWKGKG